MRIGFFIAFLLIDAGLIAQFPASTPPSSLRQTLEVSKRRGQLEMEGAPPFHLVASFEYSVDGNTTEKGTLDELWKDNHHFRQAISLPKRELVEVDNDEQDWRTGGWSLNGSASDVINAATMPFAPLPSGDLLSVEGQQNGSKNLDCIGTEPTLPGVSPTLLIAETTFCMAPGNHLLQLTARPNKITLVFANIQPFQNKYIPRLIEVYRNAILTARLHIDSLTTADDFSALDIAIPEEAQKVPFHRKDLPFYAGLQRGQVVKGADTLLPHLGHQGTALIKVHIDMKGDVASAEVVSSPSVFVTNAALSSVRNWRFRAGYDGDHLVEFDDGINFTIDH